MNDEKVVVEEITEISIETVEIEQDGSSDSIDSDQVSSWTAFFIGYALIIANIAVRVYCGLYMIISDCDESYNYWEPLNRITRGFGKETWEYSPAYAIRSYAYLLPYYLVSGPFRDYNHLMGLKLPSYAEFYFIRVVALAGFTAFSELKIYGSVKRNFSQTSANWYLLFTTFAPGMSHSSVALLPSAFAMTWINWGTASALNVLSDVNTLEVVKPSIHAIFCFLVAGLFGWPFALAIGIPFGLFTLRARYQTPPLTRIVFACWGLLPALVIILLVVDSYFYSRDFLFVPFNIVLYNVFAIDGEGPEIFGVEDFSYYILNLALNFNIVFVLGYLGAVVNPYLSNQKHRAAFGASVPILVWSFIFFRQPHKEERFLYPIYSLICLSASIFTTDVLKLVRLVITLKFVSRALITLSSLLYILVSTSRILALVNEYSAPLTTATIFNEMESQNPSPPSQLVNVCVGREWYHFPTSFFLPDNHRLRFVQSGFDGLLPGDFKENVSLKEAASFYPEGMNSKNLFSADKVVTLDECDYYIDNTSPVNSKTGEPELVKNSLVDPNWETLTCESIADPSHEGFNLGRVFYIPLILRELIPLEKHEMDYCVFRRSV